MKLEQTIQAMFNEYPTLFNERWEVLDHLFCVIGNGYEWKKGELISNSGKLKNMKNKDVELRGTGVARQTIDDPDYFRLKRLCKDRNWYPLCASSYLFDYPNDIKPDWLAGIEETKEYLKMSGISTNIEDYKK